jgi:hypothetical protein
MRTGGYLLNAGRPACPGCPGRAAGAGLPNATHPALPVPTRTGLAIRTDVAQIPKFPLLGFGSYGLWTNSSHQPSTQVDVTQ